MREKSPAPEEGQCYPKQALGAWLSRQAGARLSRCRATLDLDAGSFTIRALAPQRSAVLRQRRGVLLQRSPVRHGRPELRLATLA